MPFLTVNPDNSIEDVTTTDESGQGIEVDETDLSEIISSVHGHIGFDFVAGNIVKNDQREDDLDFLKEKKEYEKLLIRQGAEEAAREKKSGKLTALENLTDRAALKALKDTP